MVNNIRLTLLTVLILPCLLQYPASAQLRVKDLCPAVDSINGRLMGRTSVLPEISIDTFLISKKNKRVDSGKTASTRDTHIVTISEEFVKWFPTEPFVENH